jgi:hypothetical protein
MLKKMTVNNPNAYLEKEFQAQTFDVLVKLGYMPLTSCSEAATEGDPE